MKFKELWRVNPLCNLFWKEWDDSKQRVVVFNASCSETHWLNELGAQTLKFLATESLSKTELLESFATIYEDFPLDHEMDSYVEDILLGLEQQGLIEPVS